MRKSYVIVVIFTTIFTSTLLAGNEFTFTGGLNLASINYNDNDIDEYVDIKSKAGFVVGLESQSKPMIFGAAFVQRGTVMDPNYGNEKYVDTFNYIDFYVLIPFQISKQFIPFSAFECGIPIGGKEKRTDYDGDTNTSDIKADEFNFEYGLKVGADLMLTPVVGIRGSFYWGLSDVVKDIESDDNFKNREITFNIILKVK